MKVVSVYHSGEFVITDATELRLREMGIEVVHYNERELPESLPECDAILQLGVGEGQHPTGLRCLYALWGKKPNTPIVVYSRNGLPHIRTLVEGVPGAHFLPRNPWIGTLVKKLRDIVAQAKTAGSP